MWPKPATDDVSLKSISQHVSKGKTCTCTCIEKCTFVNYSYKCMHSHTHPEQISRVAVLILQMHFNALRRMCKFKSGSTTCLVSYFLCWTQQLQTDRVCTTCACKQQQKYDVNWKCSMALSLLIVNTLLQKKACKYTHIHKLQHVVAFIFCHKCLQVSGWYYLTRRTFVSRKEKCRN